MKNTFKLGMHALANLIRPILTICALLFTIVVNAQAPHAPLLQANDVELLAWVGKSGTTSESKETPKFSVNEQVILYIDVATPRWFTRGTRIGNVEIPNVIAKQRNQLATNYTERKGGKTWSRQRWEITLYPQASGEYIVPPIAVSVEVSGSDGSKASGTLYTQPIKFEASMPSGLLNQELQWFAATSVEVEQEWQTSNDDLKVGDAITRTIAIHAQDSLSVLLPNLLSNESTASYQAYPQPNRLDDTQTRGDYQSSRIEEIVYVIQQGGEFTLPEHQFQWWNSKTKQLETVLVEGRTFDAKHTLNSFIRTYSGWLLGLVVTLFVISGAALSLQRYYRARPKPAWLLFHRMTKAQQWGAVRALLYRQFRANTGLLEMNKVNDAKDWQQYSMRLQSGEENRGLMHSVWRSIQGMKSKRFQFKLPKALPKLAEIVQTRDTNK